MITDTALIIYIGLAAIGFFLVSQMPRSKMAKVGTLFVVMAMLLRVVILLAGEG